MSEVFQVIVDRHGKPGRTEKFVSIEVHVSDEPVDVDWNLLDRRGRKDLRKCGGDTGYQAVAGVAKIAWKGEEDHAACIADHQQSEKRQRRWKKTKEGLERMKAGEFPQFAHAYLHPSLTGVEGLTVIDGTRRMLAYLELGRSEMPVVVFRAVSNEGGGEGIGDDVSKRQSGNDQMNDEPAFDEGAKQERLKNAILDETMRTLDERAYRLGQVESLGIVPYGVFGAPSVECVDLFRDGHYYGCISLVQAVTEAIVRHVWQVKFRKKKSAEGEFEANLESLYKKGFIDDTIKATITAIWEDRNSFHHLKLSLEKDIRDLEQLAADKLRLVAEVEKHFFGFSIEEGLLKPHHPEYWDIKPGGETLVYVRGRL